MKRTSGALLAAACALAAVLTLAPPGDAGQVSFDGAGGHYGVPVISLKEARFQTVIRQQYDFSCGSAAVATLLTYHYDTPTSETEVFKEMWQHGDRAQIRKLGFSMLDMKLYLEGRGFVADGFEIGIDDLAKVGVPAITLVNTRGYNHFIVVKGLIGDDILVGDPALGVNVVPRKAFEAVWNGVVFVVRNRADVARAYFNNKRDWRVRPRAPAENGLIRDGLSSFGLLLPGRNQF